MIRLKSQDEINKIRAAGRLVKAVLDAMQAAIHPGISTYELDQVAMKVIEAAGGSGPCIGYGDPPFPTATCISLDENVRGIPLKIVSSGMDKRYIRCSLRIDGWMADAARTFLWEISPRTGVDGCGGSSRAGFSCENWQPCWGHIRCCPELC